MQADSFVRQVGDDQDLVDLLSALREDSVVAEGGLYSGLPPPLARSRQVGSPPPLLFPSNHTNVLEGLPLPI